MDPQVYALIYNYIASAHQQLGNYEMAVQRLTESLEILAFELGEDHPDFATGNFELGKLYAEMGKQKEAQLAFGKYFTLQKENFEKEVQLYYFVGKNNNFIFSISKILFHSFTIACR